MSFSLPVRRGNLCLAVIQKPARKSLGKRKHPRPKPGAFSFLLVKHCAREGTRTPNLLIRSQVLYPLSYARNLVNFGDMFNAFLRQSRRSWPWITLQLLLSYA